jgi:hypothetical protein
MGEHGQAGHMLFFQHAMAFHQGAIIAEMAHCTFTPSIANKRRIMIAPYTPRAS